MTADQHPFDYRKAIAAVCLVLIVLVALNARLELLVLRGGLWDDQLQWSRIYYMAGVTSGYVETARAISDGWLWAGAMGDMPGLARQGIGYPLFLAALEALGLSEPVEWRIAQCVLDAGAALAVFYVALRLTGATVAGLFSAFLYAILPPVAEGAGFLLAESIVPAMFTALLALIVFARTRGLYWWALVGAWGGAMALVRPDLMLLGGALGLFGYIVSAVDRPRRIAVTIAAFSALPIAYGLRNLFLADTFAINPPTFWYAMWSGLGEIPNAFGYMVSDANAGAILREQGIRYHSGEAETFWRSEYLSALTSHPDHVLRATLHRLGRILFSYAHWGVDYFEGRTLGRFFFLAPFATAFAVGWLLFRRNLFAALVVSLPLLYALGSLGPMYLEERYVRYATLTPVIAWPMLFTLVASALPFASPRPAVLLVPFALALALFIPNAALLHSRARETVRADTVRSGPSVALEFIAQGGVTMIGDRLLSGPPDVGYLAFARLPDDADFVRLDYNLVSRKGGVLLGILRVQDGEQVWLASRPIGPPDAASGTLSVPYQPPAFVGLTTYRPDLGRTDVDLHLEARFPRPDYRPIPALYMMGLF